MNGLAVAVWAAVALSTVLLLLAVRRARPPVTRPAPELHDLAEAAFLAGGPGTVVDSALVSLLGDGRLAVGGPGIVQARPGARGADPAERAVLRALAQAPSGWLYQVRYAAMREPAVQETGDALAARGLLSAPGAGRGARRWG
ncbi:TIGR04222 domain-containing membrane protein, partial [Streptomyces sp. WAC07061]|uniref:TIGR04222 domain-containing membrane protein n=1 Tax=Streptomyces sp. WAC07061 TaxID=2487410 RepID=UPI000F7BA135